MMQVQMKPFHSKGLSVDLFYIINANTFLPFHAKPVSSWTYLPPCQLVGEEALARRGLDPVPLRHTFRLFRCEVNIHRAVYIRRRVLMAARADPLSNPWTMPNSAASPAMARTVSGLVS
jgi:hypothetical protein